PERLGDLGLRRRSRHEQRLRGGDVELRDAAVAHRLAAGERQGRRERERGREPGSRQRRRERGHRRGGRRGGGGGGGPGGGGRRRGLRCGRRPRRRRRQVVVQRVQRRRGAVVRHIRRRRLRRVHVVEDDARVVGPALVPERQVERAVAQVVRPVEQRG